ncbi:MAG: hypothetical protein ACOCX3_00395 [Chloroflexota bacterium]
MVFAAFVTLSSGAALLFLVTMVSRVLMSWLLCHMQPVAGHTIMAEQGSDIMLAVCVVLPTAALFAY